MLLGTLAGLINYLFLGCSEFLRPKRAMKSCQEGVKMLRKEVEKNRRIHMKTLCFKLTSLIPPHYLKEAFSQQEQLDQAAVYIKGLAQQVDRLREKRKLIMTVSMGEINSGMSSGLMLGGHSSPVVEVTEIGSNLKVVLMISDPPRKFFFCDVIGVLEEEGLEVTNANFTLLGDKALHIIQSQVLYTRLGFDAERVHQRLNELVYTASWPLEEHN